MIKKVLLMIGCFISCSSFMSCGTLIYKLSPKYPFTVKVSSVGSAVFDINEKSISISNPQAIQLSIPYDFIAQYGITKVKYWVTLIGDGGVETVVKRGESTDCRSPIDLAFDSVDNGMYYVNVEAHDGVRLFDAAKFTVFVHIPVTNPILEDKTK